jgi:hypothetical protein
MYIWSLQSYEIHIDSKMAAVVKQINMSSSYMVLF